MLQDDLECSIGLCKKARDSYNETGHLRYSAFETELKTRIGKIRSDLQQVIKEQLKISGRLPLHARVMLNASRVESEGLSSI